MQAVQTMAEPVRGTRKDPKAQATIKKYNMNGEIRQTKKIMTKVFNTEEVDWTKQPMFFGAEPNTQTV